jgi:phosphate transport system protein
VTHYEERLEQDRGRIRAGVVAVAAKIDTALRQAVRSILTGDHALAYRTVLGDLPINRDVRELDRLCHAFVARHLPSARHLRYVSAVLRLNVALERTGDYAVAISRESVRLSKPPPETVRRDIEQLADRVQHVLAQALQAFADESAELARGTIGMADQIARSFDNVFRDLELAGEQGKRPVRDLLALLVVLNRLSRVGDQAKNVCEETIFAVTGETKPPKIYRVLFVDEKNDCVSQLAEAFARKAYPESGVYASAGWNPASQICPSLSRFLERNGYDVRAARPKEMNEFVPELADFHVVVGLSPEARRNLPEIPFHTALLQWDVGACPADLGAEAVDPAIGEVHARIAQHVEDLMRTLRGEAAC